MNKKTIAIAITAAMLVSLLPSEPGAAAKKQKPTMPKQITVNVGKTKTIKITSKKRIKKTKWSLGKKDKKIISIRGKKTSVVVKGKKSGKAVLTARVTIGKKSYKLKTSIIVKDSKGKKPEEYSTQQPQQTQPAVNQPVVTQPAATQGVARPTSGSQNVLPSTKKPSPSPTRKPAKTPVPTWTTSVVNGFYLPRIDENEVVSWDCLYFGNYWQEDTNNDGKVDEKDEKQPIKWRILSIENNTAFLLADRSLASRPNMDEEKGETSWENSEVRKWLNNDFYNDAFSEEEKQGVVLKKLDNTEDTEEFQSGNSTQDKVALLSLRELAVERYGLLRGRCSRYTSDGSTDWAVRTIAVSESYGNRFIDVPTSAKIYRNWSVGEKIGMRPIIYLNLSSKQWKKAESVSSVPYELEDEEQTLPQIPEVSDEVTEFDEKNIVHQGVDGKITWKIDKNGCLLLEGNGGWIGLGDSFVIAGGENQNYPKWLDYSDHIISAKVKISGIINCQRMFGDCTKLKAIDLSEFDTSKVIFMEEMFWNCSSLRSIDLSALDTSSVLSMDSMFSGCENLKKIIWGDFNTKRVTNMRSMFWGCESIQELDLSAFNTKQVTNMRSMFDGCESIQELDLSAFDTSKVTNMKYMFDSCKKLEKLDLSSFDLTAIEFDDDTKTLFELEDLENLVELKTPKHLSEDLFIEDEIWGSINTKELPKWTINTTPWKDEKGRIYNELPVDADSKSSITLTRQVRNLQRLSGISGDLKWNVDLQGKLTITGSGEWKEAWEDYPDWHEARDYITSCEVDITDIKDASDFFADLPYLQHTTFTRFDTSKTTNMSGMFSKCFSLKQLDLSGFDTSKTTNMSGMFSRCLSLEQLNLSEFDTSNVEDMSYMFSSCEALSTVNLSSFNTSKVTDMWGMFYGCHDLTEINLTNFKITEGVLLLDMFENCFGLKEIQMDWNVAGISSLQCIFKCCHNLQSLDLSKWDLSKVESGGEYFLSGEVSLSQIKTPVNLSKEVSLPDGIWKDEDGNRYTVLPQNRTTSILLKKE